ncbi:MAG: hypothetical protein P1U56_14615 [Saprospiraceae bacterium]|nr:hypothetical protein [Saprospiraceae bacterium]
MKLTMKISVLAGLSFLLVFTSCTNEEINVSDFANESLFLVESETRSGKLGCYELIYPVRIDFPDGSTQEVDNAEMLKDAVKGWKENNLDVSGRPHLQFPYDIITEDGTIVTVETREQRRQLMIACKVSMGQGPHAHLGKPCFKIVYPISITFPNENELEVDSRHELRFVVRQWRKNNPYVEDRPSLVFPIEVIFADESIQVINSKEELKQLKIDCRE